MDFELEHSPHERQLAFRGHIFVEESRAGISTWSILLEGVQDAEEVRRHAFGSLPEKLLALRKAFRQKQNGMAELLGIKEKTYQNWEQGIRVPRGPARRLLELIFQVPKIAVLHLKEIQDDELVAVAATPVESTIPQGDYLVVERVGTNWHIRHSEESEPISEHGGRDEAVIRALSLGTGENNDVLIRLTK